MNGRLRVVVTIAAVLAGLSVLWPGQARATPPGWTITQITDNDYHDSAPKVSGTNVVWEADLGPSTLLEDREIFFYDGQSITRLTDNDYPDMLPQISGSNVVWNAKPDGYTGAGEISLYDGQGVTRLTDNDPGAWGGRVSGANVAWLAIVPGSNYDDVFFHDGVSTRRLTDEEHPASRREVDVSGSNVVWPGFNYDIWEEVIWLHDGAATTSLYGGAWINKYPKVSGSNVAWQGKYGAAGDDQEIFFYNGQSVRQLTDNDYHDWAPEISGSNVAWEAHPDWAVDPDELEADWGDSEIFFFDGFTVIQLTDNDYSDRHVRISGSNVVWSGFDGHDDEIFFFDGETIIQLTDNDWYDGHPDISGSTVVWHGYRGDSEIFMATYVPEPSTVALLALGVGAILAGRRRRRRPGHLHR